MDAKMIGHYKAKTDRELQEDIAMKIYMNQKHLKSISGNVAFLFWVTLIGLLILIGSVILATDDATQNLIN